MFRNLPLTLVKNLKALPFLIYLWLSPLYARTSCSLILNEVLSKNHASEGHLQLTTDAEINALIDLENFLLRPQFFFPENFLSQDLALHKNSFVLDFHFISRFHFKKLNKYFREFGIYTDPSSLVDFRMMGVEYQEMISFHDGYQAIKTWMPNGISLNIDRTNPEYIRIYKILYKFHVGEMKKGSFKDRAIIADLFFSLADNDAVPTFVTGDKGIYLRMARIGKVFIDKENPLPFEITLFGRTIKIIPIKISQYDLLYRD